MRTVAEIENLKKLGDRLKELRLAKGYSSYEPFAYENNLSRALYGRYEAGKGNPTFLNLIKMAEAFNISLSEMLQGIDFDYQ